MWKWGKWKIAKRKRRLGSSVTKHYIQHKEAARALTVDRLSHFNEYYKHSWGRVAIRNQRRCWGSCSSLKNLNFNYKILFLPSHLSDYIIVHELCHLEQMNHGADFWKLVEQKMPDYKQHVVELKLIERGLHESFSLSEIIRSNTRIN